MDQDEMPKLTSEEPLQIKTKRSSEDLIPVLTNENNEIQTPTCKTIAIESSSLKSDILKSPINLAGRSLIETITTCYICRQEFVNYAALKSHMSKHRTGNSVSTKNDDEIITCGICDLKCRTKAMSEHMKSHEYLDEDDAENESHFLNERIAEACASLDVSNINPTLSEQQTKSHESLSDDDVVNCGICDYECKGLYLASHMECHNKEAESQNLNELFTKIDHPKGSSIEGRITESVVKAFKCNNCKYSAYRRSRMREHVQSCAFKVPQFGCETCGKLFRAKRYLVLHRKVHEIDEEWLPPSASSDLQKKACTFKCDKCNYKTYRGGRLREHMLVCGVTEPRHKCDVCGKLFKAKRYLVGHMKAHTEGYFTCSKCGYNTDRKGRLNEHLQSCMATGLNYNCDICNKSFKARRNLAAHKRRYCMKNESIDNKDKQPHINLAADTFCQIMKINTEMTNELDNESYAQMKEELIEDGEGEDGEEGEGGISVYNMLIEEEDLDETDLNIFNLSNDPHDDDDKIRGKDG